MTADEVRVLLTLPEARVLHALARRARPRTTEEVDLVAALSVAVTVANTTEPAR